MRLTFSERYVVALNFLLIAGCAYFAARAANDLVARHLIVIPPPPLIAAAQHAPIQLSRADYDLVVQRDVFNEVKVVEAPPPPPAPQATATDLHVKLVGTSHLSWTKPFAILEDNNTHDQAVYQLGDQIPDAGQLVAVERSRVTIDHNGTRINLDIPTDQPDTGMAQAPVPVPMVPAFPPRFGRRDVRRIGPNEFAIERAALDRNLQNMGQLFTQMRAIPDMENGKSDGFRLSEVVPGSLFQQMGLRNGDVVSSIGGQDLSDPTQAIALLNGLRNASSLSITVMRRGRPVELQYQIQ
ncbi:MAG: type II secretion system protein GspC [Candidatus Binataceae bacterium]